jgi:DNA (cytosine-5)-methyltransferase 1
VLSANAVCPSLAHSSNTNGGNHQPKVWSGMSVRRLTPTECERLQGFPDGWTAIPWKGKPASECPDGPRYRALGNSMAVNVMRWIGRRIEMVDAL